MKNGNTGSAGVEALAGGGCPGLQWCAKTHRLKPLLQHGRFPSATLERENHFWDRFYSFTTVMPAGLLRTLLTF